MQRHPLDGKVATLLRDVAARAVMPRYRTLAAHDIIEKSPGDLVTIADNEAEEMIGNGLSGLLPDARVIGEEAVAADPTLLDGLGEGIAWIIDPIDGTGNFAAGRPFFALMVALIADGVVQAGWVYHPIAGLMCHAALGGGAFVNDAPLHIPSVDRPRTLCAFGTRYLPEARREAIEARVAERGASIALVDIPFCAGEQYRRIAMGDNDAALFWRTLPWDHAPGALFVQEAGGKVARLDGTAYHPADGGRGLIAAASPRLWDEAAAIVGN